MSTWRDVLDHIGVETTEQANEWLSDHIWPTTLIAPPFPQLDDPNEQVDLRNDGVSHKTLRFPFMHAEWESTLLEIFDEAVARNGGVPDFPWGTAD